MWMCQRSYRERCSLRWRDGELLWHPGVELKLISSQVWLESQTGDKEDLAGLNFIKLLRRLRITFLQDVVHWRTRLPEYFLWENALFQDPLYLNFEQQARAQSEHQSVNFSVDAQRVMPEITTTITTYQAAHEQRLVTINGRMEGLEHGVGEILQAVRATDSGIATIVHALARPQQVTVNIPGVLQQPTFTLTGPSQSDTGHTPTALAILPSHPKSTSQPAASSHTQSTPISTTVTVPGALPQQLMSRKLEKVTDVWREYVSGINGTAIKAVYASTSEWRKNNDSERRFYDGRRVIYDAVEQWAQERGIPEVEAAVHLEAARIAEGYSISKLILRMPSVLQHAGIQGASLSLDGRSGAGKGKRKSKA